MVASHYRKMSLGIREAPGFNIFDPGAVHADGNIVLRFASNSTGMATDAPPVVDDKAKVGLPVAVSQSHVLHRKRSG